MKTVSVVAYNFDCLPGHVTITKRGTGGSVRVALERAVASICDDDQLRHKRIGDFKMSVVVVENAKPERLTRQV